MSRKWIAGALVAAVAGTAAWWWLERTRPVERLSCRGCNVLLVTIDTLRRDRVGAFGAPAGLTPTLDRLASEGLRFTRAYTSAPLTLPSHASLLTAVSPPRHGVRANGLFRLGPSLPTLATMLQQAGYRTGAFVGAFVLDARFGLDRGFDLYDDRYGEKHAGDDTEGAERRAVDVVKPAAAWISSLQSNPQWFAWVHLFDPHEPYRAPEPYASQHAAYDAEVAYTDAMVGRLLADIGPAALEQTLVVVAADHGESLGEHGERSHGVFAYDVTMRVPLIVWAGRRLGGQSWDGLTRLIDVTPTILDVVGVAAPSGLEGRSLIAAMASRDTAAPPAYFEAMDANITRNWAPLTGVVSGHDKLIDLPIAELYDVDADPQESSNLFTEQSDRVRTLQSLLRTATAFARDGASSERTALSADARQRLQSLGYIASAAAPGTRLYSDKDDPKQLIEPANVLNQSLALFKSGSAPEAIESVRAIIRAHPDFSTAYGVLASMQRDTGNLPEAIETLDTIVRRGVADQSVLVVLAAYLQESGALARSAEVLEAVVAAHPDYADAFNSLGVAYSRMRERERAKAAFQKVLALDPTSATAYENLGVDALMAGDLGTAVQMLTRALELDPALAAAHNALATALLRQGRRAEALEHWRTAVQLNPRLYDALYNLGTVLYTNGQRAEARPFLERFVDEAPPARYAPDIAHIRRMLDR